MAEFYDLETRIVNDQTWIARIYGGEFRDTTEKSQRERIYADIW